MLGFVVVGCQRILVLRGVRVRVTVLDIVIQGIHVIWPDGFANTQQLVSSIDLILCNNLLIILYYLILSTQYCVYFLTGL